LAPVPAEFDAWFKRATARDPSARFQSAKEFTEALHVALTSEMPAAAEPALQPAHLHDSNSARALGSRETPISRVAGVRPAPWIFAGVAAVLAIAAVGGWLWLSRAESGAGHIVKPATREARALREEGTEDVLPSAEPAQPATIADVEHLPTHAPPSPKAEPAASTPVRKAAGSPDKRTLSAEPRAPKTRPAPHRTVVPPSAAGTKSAASKAVSKPDLGF
jgi:serine/threonine-protein kinase